MAVFLTPAVHGRVSAVWRAIRIAQLRAGNSDPATIGDAVEAALNLSTIEAKLGLTPSSEGADNVAKPDDSKT
jgi:hypothetical protein